MRKDPDVLLANLWALIPLLIIAAIPIVFFGCIWLAFSLLRGQRRQAKKYGYPSTAAYLRSAPQTDAEKRDAADLALKGLAMCLMGLVLPPLLIIGLFPFFFGARKLVYASMGLGLVD